MHIGRKIKYLRQQKGITQEKLAEYLGISYQAISKWENDVAYPDITMLPKISVYFGITIDELFEISEDAHFERIENMLETVRELTSEDETYVKSYLSGFLEDKLNKAKAHGLLAELYNHRAKSMHEKAKVHAMEALALNPEVKGYHVALVESSRGICADWNYKNHRDLCRYYEQFTQKYSKSRRGLLFYLDHLIADGRIKEATKAVEDLKKLDTGYIGLLYEGKIEMRRGNVDHAFTIWNSMVNQYSDQWLVFSSRGDEYAYTEQYDKAIADYTTSM